MTERERMFFGLVVAIIIPLGTRLRGSPMRLNQYPSSCRSTQNPLSRHATEALNIQAKLSSQSKEFI